MILCERIVNTNEYAGTCDIITGIEDFEAEATFNSEWHTYRINGVIVPSVTQLLADDTYINVDPIVLERAAKKGTLVHKEIQEWLESGKNGYTDELYEFIRLYEENKELFNQKAIFDIKTTCRLDKKKTKKQCEMYAEGVKHLTGEVIEKLYAIWLPSGKKGEIVELSVNYKELKTDFNNKVDLEEINRILEL